jgi:hypothetical protein
MQDTATCSTPRPRAGIEGLDVYRVSVESYRLLRKSTRGRVSDIPFAEKMEVWTQAGYCDATGGNGQPIRK